MDFSICVSILLRFLSKIYLFFFCKNEPWAWGYMQLLTTWSRCYELTSSPRVAVVTAEQPLYPLLETFVLASS